MPRTYRKSTREFGVAAGRAAGHRARLGRPVGVAIEGLESRQLMTTVLGFDVNGVTGNAGSPLAHSVIDAGLTASTGLVRDAGVSTTNATAGNTYGGSGFSTVSAADGNAANKDLLFGFTVAAGKSASLNSIDAWVRRSNSGPANLAWSYKVGAGAFVQLVDVPSATTGTSGTGNHLAAPVDLTGQAALQNLAPGTAVTFRVTPYGGGGAGTTWYVSNGNSGPDLLVNGTISNAAAAPAAPSGLTATAASGTQVNLAWADNSGNETGFIVERATNAAFTAGLTSLTTTGQDVTTYADTTVSAGNTYFYRVRATNGSGDSANSNTATVSTPAPTVSVVSLVGPATTAVNEGATLTYTVSRTNFATAGAIVVNYAIAGTSTGADGSDISSVLAGTVSLAAGQESTTFDVVTNNDPAIEPAETFGVTIALAGTPANTTLGTATGTFTINASDQYFGLVGGTFSQNWSNTGLISANNDWSQVPNVKGFLSGVDNAASSTDPASVTANFPDASPNVIANQANPGTLTSGGVAEFEVANPVVALQGSGTADAPYLTFYMDSTGVTNGVAVKYKVRDIDPSADNAIQKVVLQYRTSPTGDWVNVDNGPTALNAVIDDATEGGTDTKETNVSVVLPGDANNQATLEVRVMTGNASGNDEWVGIDDVVIAPFVATPGAVQFTAGTARVNESAGQIEIPVVRDGSTGAVSATFTATGASATAGTDFGTAGSTAPYTGTVTFADGSTTGTAVVPILSDTTDELAETFTVVLSSPTGGATLGTTTSTTVTIADDDGAVLAAGPFTQNWNDPALITNSWDTVSNVVGYADDFGTVSLIANQNNAGGVSLGGVAEFEDAGTVALQPTNVQNHPQLVIDVNTQGVSGATVSFNARDLDGSMDDAVQQITVAYRVGSTGDFNTFYTIDDATTGPSLADLVTAVSNVALPEGAIGQQLVQIQIASTRTAGSNEWVGIDDIQVAATTTVGLPAWVQPGSAATWDAGTKTLTVTGATTIVADPGADLPKVVASGAAAQVAVAPAAGTTFVHLGGLSLASDADMDVRSVGAARSHGNHLVLVVGTTGGPTPTFSVDAIGGSKLDLRDNDLIIHSAGGYGTAGFAAVTAAGSAGRAGGAWSGNGITSSAAAGFDAENFGEFAALAVQPNDFSLLGGQYAQWAVGSGSEALDAGGSDVIVKYTYVGDFNLDGKVDALDASIIGNGYDNGATTGNPWGVGDTNNDGKVDGLDGSAFGNLYGLGTPSSGLAAL